MMSIGKLVAGPGVGRYYIDQVAQGREDYYAGEGEAAGVWMGTGAALLGLSGEVGEEELARLLEGRDPCSGLLLRPLRSSSPVAGFDLTLRAPKSVSILFGVAEPEVAQRVVRAHEQAVGAGDRVPRARGVLDSSGRRRRDPAAGARASSRRRFGTGPRARAIRCCTRTWSSRTRRRRRMVVGRRSTAVSCTGMRRPPATSTRPACGRSCRASSGCAGRRSCTGAPIWRACRGG